MKRSATIENELPFSTYPREAFEEQSKPQGRKKNRRISILNFILAVRGSVEMQ